MRRYYMNRQTTLSTIPGDKIIVRCTAGLVLTEEPGIAWALDELKERLEERSIDLVQAGGAADGLLEIVLGLGAGEEAIRAASGGGVVLPVEPEALAIFRGKDEAAHLLFVHGADKRGLIYAITELADRVRYGGAETLAFSEPLVERPAMRVRSISKCFESVTEDMTWYHDRPGWDDYLTQLVTHRFNRITLTMGMQYNYPYGNEFLSDVHFSLA